MRLPFLQVESDLIAHGAAEVGHLAGCPVALALGHVAMLRAWAVSAADEKAPPDGWVPGDAAGRRIEAAAQWTGAPGRLLQALLDAGQVRSEDGGIRVLHLEPYAKAWEQNRTSKERMRKLRERSANTDERPAKFDGQTQTQTQKETAASQEPEPVPEPFALELQKPEKRPRKQSEQERVYALMEERKERRCAEVGEPYVSDGWKAARVNRDFGWLKSATPKAAQRFSDAWGLYLADDGNRVRKPAWSIAFFMSSGVRARYETDAARLEGSDDAANDG